MRRTTTKPQEKTNRTFRLDAETMKRLETMAEEQNRTVNNMVETILKQTVKQVLV